MKKMLHIKLHVVPSSAPEMDVAMSNNPIKSIGSILGFHSSIDPDGSLVAQCDDIMEQENTFPNSYGTQSEK